MLCYVMLCYFILFYFILFYFIYGGGGEGKGIVAIYIVD